MRLMHVITSSNPNAICALSPFSYPSYLAHPAPTPPPTASPSAPASSSAAIATSGDIRIIDTHYPPARSLPPPRKKEQSFGYLASPPPNGCTSYGEDTLSREKTRGNSAPSSPGGSVDSQETGKGGTGMEGGYEAYMEGKKNGVGSSLRRKSLGLTRGIAGTMGGYLPGSLSDMWEPSRDFASLKLPTSGTRCIVALSSNTPNVMVVSSEGLFYSYTIDLDNGGECVLSKQCSLLDSTEDSNDASPTKAKDA